ncbi:ankyrin repeat domain-containing protein [Vreelandella boliviensis]|uniref:ankyrin repeat domain-containing protein n=1 Tax=Vreelandella boliviensis TaxID=223527 RepID=UPI001B8C0F45|nr:ankyrin repeat domain-containing protein [Halomonas boliviensis]MBS3667628.1 ankyrin repeat domain-containing protein [Halomonas boliviensis]
MNTKHHLRIIITLILSAMSCSVIADCVCECEANPDTPLNQAILALDDNTLALELLSNGSNPDITNACNSGLLLMAAIYNDVILAEKLLSDGANPDIINFMGETPITAASQWSSNEVLSMLLENGGNPNPKIHSCLESEKYNTPLLIAAANNNLEGIKLLLEHGANFTTTSPDGATFLDILLRRGNDLEKILDILKTIPEEEKNQAENELLFEVARRKTMSSELNHLLSISFNPNFSIDDDAPYNTPLLIAALAENIEGVEALIEHGADIHYTNSEGYSLERIVHENNIEELYYLFPSTEE